MNNRYREEEKEMQTEENIDDLVSENVEESVADEEKCECDKDQECCKEHGKGKKHNALKEKINKLEEENKKLKDQYYRTLADSENFKKRIDDERIRERKYGSQKLIEKLYNYEKTLGLNGAVLLIHPGVNEERTDRLYNRLGEIVQ